MELVIKILAFTVLGVIIFIALGSVKPEDLSQEKYPSTPWRW